MKTFAFALVAAASADKKVKPRHPLQCLKRLSEFAAEWCNDNLIPKQSLHWKPKFIKNIDRLEKRFTLCGFFDNNQLEHGGPPPRKRRDDDLVENCEYAQNPLCQYDKLNPINGIKQITNGFREFAERYVANCKLKPGRQIDRANKWFNILANKYVAKNQAKYKQFTEYAEYA